jgi:hypothetical protein
MLAIILTLIILTFGSIEPCNQMLLAGDSTTVIESYGVTYTMVQKPDGSKKKMRLRAAYIPKFHTNISSTILLRERSEIYWTNTRCSFNGSRTGNATRNFIRTIE